MQERIAEWQTRSDEFAEADRLIGEEIRRLEEEARIAAEAEAQRLAEEEARRLAEEEAQRLAEEEAADDPAPSPPSGDFAITHRPTAGALTSSFGPRVHPIFGTTRTHNGIDLNGDTGDLILAANDGVVLSAGWRTGYGNAIVISHGGGIRRSTHICTTSMSALGNRCRGATDRLARQHRLVDWAAPALRGPTRRHRSRPDRLLPVLTVPSMGSARDRSRVRPMTPERRALIVAAASPQQLVDIETRPDVVIAADSGLHAVLAAGWIPDRVIGDLDSVDPAAVEIAAEGGAVVDRHPVGKDETDLELALAAAVDAGATEIQVVVALTGVLIISSPTCSHSPSPTGVPPKFAPMSVTIACGWCAANVASRSASVSISRSCRSEVPPG